LPNFSFIPTVGKQTLLLGADLEEDGDSDLGWSAIVSMNERPQGKAQIFKIPHHGSKNGHYRPVWDLMLVKNPISILTPWSKGSGLPAPTDINADHLANGFSVHNERAVKASENRTSLCSGKANQGNSWKSATD
jgi:hypothetical protein